MNGKGKITYSSGSVYEGNFKDNQPNGKGKILFSDGGSYEGSWNNGVIEGTVLQSTPMD